MTSREEMRQARLRAFGGISASKGESEGSESVPAAKKQAIHIAAPLLPDTFHELEVLLYRVGLATSSDIDRWHQEGFKFFHSPFGLHQSKGGPCGILAVVQAEVIRELMFDPVTKIAKEVTFSSSFQQEQLKEALITALLVILERSARGGQIVLVDSPENRWSADSITTSKYSSSIDARNAIAARVDSWQGHLGCWSFLVSLILTKGIKNIKREMDDSSNTCKYHRILYIISLTPHDVLTVIGQFGHCSQELLNLLLTGEASSNVFDGDRSIDGGFSVKGIHGRSTIGYLTHLEALRYCQVGDFFKVPHFPIWVVGSSSHFTVFFSLDGYTLTYANMLLDRC